MLRSSKRFESKQRTFLGISKFFHEFQNTEKSQNEFYYGQISFLLFELLGMCKPSTWTSSCKTIFYNTYSTFIITIYVIFVFSILMFIVQNTGNIANEMETLYFFLVLFTVLFKILTIFAKRKTVIEAQKIFMNKLCQPRDIFESDILQQTSISCRLYTIIYLILMNCTALSVVLLPPSRGGELTLPLKSWTPYSLNSRLLFFLTYVHQGISASLAACATSAVESLAFVIIIQICAQYEILNHRLNLLQGLPIKIHPHYPSELNVIKDSVKLHIQILSIGDTLNKLFGSIIFFQFFSSSMSLCPITFQLTKLSLMDPKSWVLLFLLISTLFQIYIYSYFGDKIMEKSIELMKSVYDMKWLYITNQTKRDLVFMMTRASRPMTFMGYKIIVMSTDTFVQIVKSAYSAYSLLRGF